MMVTRSAPVCGLTNPSGPERFRSETQHGDYRTEHAAISSRGARPGGEIASGRSRGFDQRRSEARKLHGRHYWTRIDPVRPQPGRPLEEQLNA
jgi:hypothetical protein